jgi:hypothetical protein
MGIIFQNGFSSLANVVGNIWDPQYTSGLSIYPNVANQITGGPIDVVPYNSSISNAIAPGIYASLAKTSIATGQKYVISYSIDWDGEPSNPNYLLGFGSRSINLTDALGSNDNSVGIANTGDVYYGGSVIFTGLPSFGTPGDTIDVAIDGNNKMWYRVNGGDWNGNPTADPTLNNGGLDIWWCNIVSSNINCRICST